VEEAINTHPAVVESAVIGVPHALRGAVVKAYVVLRNDFTNGTEEAEMKSSIQDHVKRTTAPYKYPREVSQAEYKLNGIRGYGLGNSIKLE